MDEIPLPESPPIKLSTYVFRALQLRCPACGQHRMFNNWISMIEQCPACGRKFNRAPGYFLGSIYFNYGVTAILIVILYFIVFFSKQFTGNQMLWLLSGFGLLFPMWFFRYARALWIAFDERWDPWPNEEERRAMIDHSKPSTRY